jgi:5'-deoxynucleotidase YfbR-like HD superfamily hydrolase
MAKLENSELDYLKELNNSINLTNNNIGAAIMQIDALEIAIENFKKEQKQSREDLQKNLEKLKEKYGKVSVDLETGEIKKDGI